jgi:hypothetical protein
MQTHKVHRPQGDADTMKVESGGKIDIVSGGKILDDGVQAAHIADVATAGAATAAANATAINSILAAMRGVGILATS